MPTKTSGSSVEPTVGREQLQRALDMGREGFRLQLRYVLMLCQIIKPRPLPTEAPLVRSINDSRLQVLTHIADKLSPQQCDSLHTMIAQVPEELPRLVWTAYAIRTYPYDLANRYAATIFERIGDLPDAVTQTQVLMALLPLLQDLPLSGGTRKSASIFHRLIRIAQAIRNPEARLRAMISIAPHLTPEQGIGLLKAVLRNLMQTNNEQLVSKSLATLAGALPIDLMQDAVDLAEGLKSPVERARALTTLTPHVLNDLRGMVRELTLRAIAKIDNEEERAEALLSIAPFLESASVSDYPTVLEHALSIAVGMSRRPLRARMLVALAPHLTRDLQGEAIAAVHSLTSERERAQLLAQLAPTLPAEMLVASLAVAYSMREQDSRVQALMSLAVYAPDSARAQTLMDALASAANLKNPYERVRILVNFLDMLPDSVHLHTLTSALESARIIENESARARAINLLGKHLTDAMLVRALDVARELTNADHRLNALLGIVSYLPHQLQPDVVQDMLACVVVSPLDYKRARALVSIAPHVTPDEMAQVEDIASTLQDPIDQLNVLIALIQHVPSRQRARLFRKAWALLVAADAGYDIASAIVTLAPYVPADDRALFLAQIVPTIERIEEEYDRASAMVILAPLLVGNEQPVHAVGSRQIVLTQAFMRAMRIPYPDQRERLLEKLAALWSEDTAPDHAFELWRKIIPLMTQLPVAEAIATLGAIYPVLHDMVGDSATTEVAQLLGMR